MSQDTVRFPSPEERGRGEREPESRAAEPAVPTAYGSAPTFETPSAPTFETPSAPTVAATNATPTIAVLALVLAFVFWPVGLVLSIMSFRRTRPPVKGRGLAVAGLVVSIVAALATVAAVVAAVVIAKNVGEPAITVTRLNAAFDDGDCDAYLASTTESYRELFAPDCETFDEVAAAAEETYDDYRTVVVNVKVEDGTAVVTTIESYTDVASGETVSGSWDYSLVRQDGDWLVDAASGS